MIEEMYIEPVVILRPIISTTLPQIEEEILEEEVLDEKILDEEI
jgi:hypothetical protein